MARGGRKPILNNRLREIFESHLKTSNTHMDAINSFLQAIEGKFAVKLTRRQLYMYWYNNYYLKGVRLTELGRSSGALLRGRKAQNKLSGKSSAVFPGKTYDEAKEMISELTNAGYVIRFTTPQGTVLEVS